MTDSFSLLRALMRNVADFLELLAEPALPIEREQGRDGLRVWRHGHAEQSIGVGLYRLGPTLVYRGADRTEVHPSSRRLRSTPLPTTIRQNVKGFDDPEDPGSRHSLSLGLSLIHISEPTRLGMISY